MVLLKKVFLRNKVLILGNSTRTFFGTVELTIVFDNNERRIFDCLPYLEIGVFKELKDWAYFSKAKVALGTVTWPNEQDFCPDTLYQESKQKSSA